MYFIFLYGCWIVGGVPWCFPIYVCPCLSNSGNTAICVQLSCITQTCHKRNVTPLFYQQCLSPYVGTVWGGGVGGGGVGSGSLCHDSHPNAGNNNIFFWLTELFKLQFSCFHDSDDSFRVFSWLVFGCLRYSFFWQSGNFLDTFQD